MAAALAAFERAVPLDDGLEIDEPEPLPFPARHWLGAALLDAGRAADAERVYRDDLQQHPRNGWSLRGLQLALFCAGQALRGHRDRVPGELAPVRHLDSRVTLLIRV